MSVATTNILSDIGLHRISRIVVMRWGGKLCDYRNSMEIAYFVHCHGHRDVQWCRDKERWVSTQGTEAFVSFDVHLKD